MSDNLDLDLIRANGALLQSIIGRNVRLEKKAGNMVGRCPFHDEKTPSFTVYDDGHFHCFGCGKHGSVFDWFMLRENIDFATAKSRVAVEAGFTRPEAKRANGNSPHAPEFEAIYDYRDAAGRLVVQAVRGRSKKFFQRQPDGRGGWIDKGHPLPPLYREKGIHEAEPGSTIWICEGEKDADRIGDHVIATTNIGGASAWRPHYAPLFARHHVVILEDNDKAGRDRSVAIKAALIGVAASVTVLALPGLPEKGDVSDWLDAGHSVEEMVRLARAARAIQQPSGRILAGADFVSQVAAPQWLIEKLVQRGRLYACTSLTGHGKTAVWLFNSCMIQAGRSIGNLRTTQGNVLYLAGENPEDVKYRLLGMIETYRMKPEHIPYVLPGNFPLTDEAAEALKKEIKALGVEFSLIVGDTAASYFPGEDENDNVAAGSYARTLRSFTRCAGSPAVITLAHPVKNAGKDNLLPRGGGAFLNELDANLINHREGDVISLHWCGKIRGPDFDPMSFRLRSVQTGLIDQWDEPFQTVVAEPMSEEAAADHARQSMSEENVVLTILRDNPSWMAAKIAEAAGWTDERGAPQRFKVHRILARLAADKLIQQTRRRGPWKITQKGEAELKC